MKTISTCLPGTSPSLESDPVVTREVMFNPPADTVTRTLLSPFSRFIRTTVPFIVFLAEVDPGLSIERIMSSGSRRAVNRSPSGGAIAVIN